MRITIDRDDKGMQRVTVRMPLHGEGHAEHTFYSETVPVVDIKEDVQAEVFIPANTEAFNAKQYDKITPRPLLSVWRGKIPTARR